MELLLKVISPQRHEMGQNAMRVFQPSGGTIGRANQNDWVLPDKHRHLSSKHATITYEQGAYFITDTSTNGVYINNAPEPLGRGHTVRLQHGDLVQVADYVIETELLQDASVVPTSGLSAETRGDDLNGLITPQKSSVELDPLASFSEQSSSSLYSFSTDASADLGQKPFDPLDGFIGAGGAQSDHDSILDSSFIPPSPAGIDPMSSNAGMPVSPQPPVSPGEPSNQPSGQQANQDLLAGFGVDGLGHSPLQSSQPPSPSIGEMGSTSLTNDPYAQNVQATQAAQSTESPNNATPTPNSAGQSLIPDDFLQGDNSQANLGYPGAVEPPGFVEEPQQQGPNFLHDDITPPGFDSERVDLATGQAQSSQVNSQGPLIPDDFMSEQGAGNFPNEAPAMNSDAGLIPDDFFADFGPAIDPQQEAKSDDDISEIAWGNHRANDEPSTDHDQPFFTEDFSGQNETTVESSQPFNQNKAEPSVQLSDASSQHNEQPSLAEPPLEQSALEQHASFDTLAEQQASKEEPLIADNPEHVVSGDDILAAFEAPAAEVPASKPAKEKDASNHQDAFNVVPAGQQAFPKPRPPRPRRGQSVSGGATPFQPAAVPPETDRSSQASRRSQLESSGQGRPQHELQKPVRVKVEQQYEAKSSASAAMPVSQQGQPTAQATLKNQQTKHQAEPPQQPTTPVKPDKAFNQLLLQLGINPEEVTAEQYNQLPATLGKVIHKTIEGLIRLMMTRANLKNEFRMSMTMIRTQENNPLKFCVSADQAITQMLVNPLQGYLDTESAVEEAFLDFDKHQLAVMAATRSALNHMLSRLDPERLEQRFEDSKSKGMSFGNKRARYWEAYKEFYQDILEEENVFQALFGNEFASAYEEQINKLNQDK
ncbi:type VI secretion system-associated FHA domain protein TagH [Zooshikella harenae]|uniref:Type VI secretion system-associated FHA domain protein TagH n=1 Tax=Zooshikella harenae TaxID=2827238 RepID=A0ABS5ZGZ7_9GAMM|nr:type VI secretion system-associated FHA domain protein TagH [Zooshikella harenae]MBU2713333.1 type VI secretion system-associated FHA domain protein TagH [Zooshikella harenae]